jgi:hypothetical protein
MQNSHRAGHLVVYPRCSCVNRGWAGVNSTTQSILEQFEPVDNSHPPSLRTKFPWPLPLRLLLRIANSIPSGFSGAPVRRDDVND